MAVRRIAPLLRRPYALALTPLCRGVVPRSQWPLLPRTAAGVLGTDVQRASFSRRHVDGFTTLQKAGMVAAGVVAGTIVVAVGGKWLFSLALRRILHQLTPDAVRVVLRSTVSSRAVRCRSHCGRRRRRDRGSLYPWQAVPPQRCQPCVAAVARRELRRVGRTSV